MRFKSEVVCAEALPFTGRWIILWVAKLEEGVSAVKVGAFVSGGQ